jgi:transcriptional adapter 2-alpha
MPGRKEFETEYENEAEQVVKDMEFFPDEDSEDVRLKWYNNLLELID